MKRILFIAAAMLAAMGAGAQVMWDYFKMFSRDPQTKKLIYHGK